MRSQAGHAARVGGLLPHSTAAPTTTTGFLSPADPAVAYAHFLGVRPDARDAGAARRLYGAFAASADADGRSWVDAVTSPGNHQSIAFHRRLGFAVSGPVPDHHGPGRDLVLFRAPVGVLLTAAPS